MRCLTLHAAWASQQVFAHDRPTPRIILAGHVSANVAEQAHAHQVGGYGGAAGQQRLERAAAGVVRAHNVLDVAALAWCHGYGRQTAGGW
jgi:hypothetical protein